MFDLLFLSIIELALLAMLRGKLNVGLQGVVDHGISLVLFTLPMTALGYNLHLLRYARQLIA